MKKCLLIYSYSAKNAGDMAITVGALDYLTSIYTECHAISRYSITQKYYKESALYLLKRYSNLKLDASPFDLDRSKGVLSVFKDYIKGFLKILFFKNSLFLKQIKEVDHVYFNGGNLLRCNSLSDLIRLIALLTPIKVALKANKKVTILPNSTSKTNFIGRIVMKSVMNKASVIFAREELSYNKFKLMFPKANIKLNTYMAFAIKSNEFKIRENRIAFTTRSQTMGDLGELSKLRKSQIKKSLKECIDFCLLNGYNIVFVVQTKKDIHFTKQLYSDYSNNVNVSLIENYDPLKLIELFSSCKLLIGMRLHSIILALNSGTPVLGYFETQWGLKNPGLLNAFNQEYVYSDNNTRGILIEKLKNHSFNQSIDLSVKILDIKKGFLDNLKP
jgi:polysaccharide pyruvyl transferase WcaK-like protein